MASSAEHGTDDRPPRHTTSKYDFVKVKVWLGEAADHYYVLSRFLVSRMLTVTMIPSVVAVKIALELKKLLIDLSLLDVSQKDLEDNLFKLMERRGYGEEYIQRYKMMTAFHHQRVPLIVIIAGAPCTGKSTIASQLAQRLNLPNVLQTDMVYEILRTSSDADAPLSPSPIWARDFESPEALVSDFARECRIVRKGLEGDLAKALKDGKPIIIEGSHLDPGVFLDMLMEQPGIVLPSHLPARIPEEGSRSTSSGDRSSPDEAMDESQATGNSAEAKIEEGVVDKPSTVEERMVADFEDQNSSPTRMAQEESGTGKTNLLFGRWRSAMTCIQPCIPSPNQSGPQLSGLRQLLQEEADSPAGSPRFTSSPIPFVPSPSPSGVSARRQMDVSDSPTNPPSQRSPADSGTSKEAGKGGGGGGGNQATGVGDGHHHPHQAARRHKLLGKAIGTKRRARREEKTRLRFRNRQM